MAKVKTKQKQRALIKRERDLTEEFRACIKKETEFWYESALIAYEIYNTEEWLKKGYLSARDYVENELEDLGISYRIFMYRVKMGEAIEKFELKKDEIVELGWTKFKDIASLLLEREDAYEVDELISKAKEMSTRELSNFVKEERMKYRHEPIQKTTRITFTLLNEQGEIVNEALKLACEFAQTNDMNVALTYICTDFLMNHSTDNETINKIRDEVIRRSEAKRQKAGRKK